MSTMIQRTYRAELEAPKGRVIIGRAVPYGTVEVVSDDGRTSYKESFRMGAFASACQPANLGRMRQYMRAEQVAAWEADVARRRAEVPPTLNYTHDESDPLNWIGRTLSLTEQSDGLHGAWEVDETERGDWALQKVRTGQLLGLSIGATIQRSTLENDVRVRVAMRLNHVALVREAAYAEAMVLATRAAALPVQHDVTDWSSRAQQLRAAVH